jgi:hypothetical protein
MDRTVASFPQRRPGLGHVGFVVDKVAMGQVFSEYFGFPCQFALHQLLHTHRAIRGWYSIGQTVADVPNGLSHPTPRKEKKNYTLLFIFCEEDKL